MFGSEYYKYPQILLSSFSEMNEVNRKTLKKVSRISQLLGLYVLIFGIPEIGFQVRSICFQKILDKRLKNLKFKRILDAGSGIGIYTFLLAKRYPKAYVEGWDLSKEKVSLSTKLTKDFKLNNVVFKLSDLTKISKTAKKFDFVVNIDVIEHIKNYKEVLKSFYDLLNDGGYLYLHTPQSNQKRIFKQLNSWHHEEHVHEGFNPESLRKDFESLGFKVIEIERTFGPFGKLAWELNHIVLKKSFILTGITYPLIYSLLFLDKFYKTKNGLGIAILAKK